MDDYDTPIWESQMLLQNNFSLPSRFIANSNGTLFFMNNSGVFEVMQKLS